VLLSPFSEWLILPKLLELLSGTSGPEWTGTSGPDWTLALVQHWSMLRPAQRTRHVQRLFFPSGSWGTPVGTSSASLLMNMLVPSGTNILTA
jgi:hypothetical protein